jgi:hypothetical protein
MPITQQRMIALITSAQDFREALNLLCDIVTDNAARAERGDITAHQALDTILLNARPPALLSEYGESAVTLTVEARHFRVTARKNERRMLRCREARGQYDSEERRNAPHTLAPRAPHRPALQPEYIPKELSTERKAEIERWIAGQQPSATLEAERAEVAAEATATNTDLDFGS